MSFSSQGPYKVGEVVTLQMIWQKNDLTFVEPTTITLKYAQLKDDGTFGPTTTVVTPDARIVNDSVGHDHMDLDTTSLQPGRWVWQARGTGVVIGIEAGVFVLTPAPLG